MPSVPALGVAVLIGMAATAIMDMWLLALSRIGMPVTNWALVGRWVGLMRKGQFAHASIGRAPQVRGERALGWLTHYVVGIAYALALVGLAGVEWSVRPTPLPALLFGIATVVVPLFVMQPAMGSGIAGSRTASPLKTCLRALVNHAAFGLGLYLAALAVALA